MHSNHTDHIKLQLVGMDENVGGWVRQNTTTKPRSTRYTRQRNNTHLATRNILRQLCFDGPTHPHLRKTQRG